MIPHVMYSRQAGTGALHALAGRHASAGMQVQAFKCRQGVRFLPA